MQNRGDREGGSSCETSQEKESYEAVIWYECGKRDIRFVGGGGWYLQKRTSISSSEKTWCVIKAGALVNPFQLSGPDTAWLANFADQTSWKEPRGDFLGPWPIGPGAVLSSSTHPWTLPELHHWPWLTNWLLGLTSDQPHYCECVCSHWAVSVWGLCWPDLGQGLPSQAPTLLTLFPCPHCAP